MARVKSFNAYSFFPHYSDPSAQAFQRRRPDLRLPACVLLRPTSPAVAGAAGAALLTELRSELHGEVPRRYRVSVLAAELTSPEDFGAFDTYEAVLFDPGLISFIVTLHELDGAWAGTLDGISRAFTPSMRAIVRPASSTTGENGPALLAGDAGGLRDEGRE